MPGHPILIEVSARHCHVSLEHLEILFGKGHNLAKVKDLSQPGQFAAQETLTLTNANGSIEKLRILGPSRSATQVELAVTDARKLKIKPFFRLSGDTAGSPGCTLVGPKGQVTLEKGVIVALRHIHLDPATAAAFKLQDKQTVAVRVGGPRGVLFEHTQVRVHKDFAPAMHVDTDEGNAAGLGESKDPIQGEIIA